MKVLPVKVVPHDLVLDAHLRGLGRFDGLFLFWL
jgi:hypothetical protein